MTKIIYHILANLCVVLGAIGAFVPILPTTPFLLLAIFLYMRSSRSGIKIIMRNRVLRPYVKSYFSKEGIPAPMLIRTIVLLWLTIGSCIIWTTESLHMRLFLSLIAVSVTVHLYLRRKK